MKKCNKMLLFTILILLTGTLSANQNTEAAAHNEVAREEARAMLQEAEMARTEAEAARLEATKAAQRARTISQRQVKEARQTNSQVQRHEEEIERTNAIQREDVERAREELSRAHRELREASREIAQAHRELSRSGQNVEVVMDVNLGDRAVIGVVLGRPTARGVELMGVSPDGPAERAGLQPGDVVVAIQGVDLVNNDDARRVAIDLMRDVSDGEVVAITAERDGQAGDYSVTAEQREPRGWQSVIRIPEDPVIADNLESVHTIIERIAVPELDQAALVAEIAELSERIESREFTFVTEDGETISQFEFEGFSEMCGLAMSDANIWFGLPQAHGLELTSINQGLGAYFKTDRGVLVIEAREGNAYELESGDVILSIGDVSVDTPSDMMRALRDVQPGSAIAIEIKRDRKDKTLQVTIPENRLGFR
jgi:C-terminal processing protease CtpA/Prc